MTRTERLFDLINLLRTRRMATTAEHIAAALGVSIRSIYRDIDTLRTMRACIDGDPGIGFRLRRGFLVPPLMFTADELDALTLGTAWVRQRADPALAAAAEAALAKIGAVLPDSIAPISAVPPLVTAASAATPADPIAASQLRDAIRRQHKVEIGYRDAQGCESVRIVWPIAIAYLDDARILAAWCEHRSAFRHFRIDRLQSVGMLDERYPQRREQLVKRWREQDSMAGLRGARKAPQSLTEPLARASPRAFLVASMRKIHAHHLFMRISLTFLRRYSQSARSTLWSTTACLWKGAGKPPGTRQSWRSIPAVCMGSTRWTAISHRKRIIASDSSWATGYNDEAMASHQDAKDRQHNTTTRL